MTLQEIREELEAAHVARMKAVATSGPFEPYVTAHKKLNLYVQDLITTAQKRPENPSEREKKALVMICGVKRRLDYEETREIFGFSAVARPIPYREKAEYDLPSYLEEALQLVDLYEQSIPR